LSGSASFQKIHVFAGPLVGEDDGDVGLFGEATASAGSDPELN
jgi:hypothetical protein